MAQPGLIATIIIPAHNEERGLSRLLGAMLANARPGEFAVLVVCNGCSDDSAAVARGFGVDVAVIELAEASKAAALAAGMDRARAFPLVLVDADVALGTEDLRALVDQLANGALATAPRRDLVRTGVSAPAGWYYDVWERLPQVESGLFGRGVIALSEEGYNRVRALPRYIADDAAFSESFGPAERTITNDAVVSVWPARTWKSLIKRRVRAVQGMRELRAAGASSAASQTHIRDLAMLATQNPHLLPRIPVFVTATLLARAQARRLEARGDIGWMRDESSRSA